jgi:hypothetical protein
MCFTVDMCLLQPVTAWTTVSATSSVSVTMDMIVSLVLYRKVILWIHIIILLERKWILKHVIHQIYWLSFLHDITNFYWFTSVWSQVLLLVSGSLLQNSHLLHSLLALLCSLLAFPPLPLLPVHFSRYTALLLSPVWWNIASTENCSESSKFRR